MWNIYKLKFVKYFPLTYYPEIGTEALVGKSDSILTGFYLNIK